jgi:hypothetical protein
VKIESTGGVVAELCQGYWARIGWSGVVGHKEQKEWKCLEAEMAHCG